MESSRAGSDSEMDLSHTSSKKKRRASPRNSKDSSTDSEFPKLKASAKGTRKKRVIRDESESRSLDKTREEEKKEDLDIDNDAETADEAIKRRFAAADTRILGDRVLIWLREVDDMRGKSCNIQGKLSGHMKKKIRYAGLAVEDLRIRMGNPTEDAAWIRMRNSELSLELRETQRETERLKNELKISRKEKSRKDNF